MHFSTLLAIVRVVLLRLSRCSCFMWAALFIMLVTNSSLVYFFFVDFTFYPSPQTKKWRSKGLGTLVAIERDHYTTVRNTTKKYQTASSYNCSHMLFRVLSACHLFQTCTRIGSVRANFKLQTNVYPHPLKIGYMFIWTYLLGIVHTTTS
jgi:hypothetical protein